MYPKYPTKHHSEEYLNLIEGGEKEFTECITSDLKYIKITEDYIVRLKVEEVISYATLEFIPATKENSSYLLKY